VNTQFKFRLIGALFVSLLMVGGLLTSLQTAQADSGTQRVSNVPEPSVATQELAATLAPSLTIDIPDTTLDLGASKTLNLLSYTTYYSDSAALVFTATTATSDYFTATIAATHYVNITSTSATTGGVFPVDIQVSDGVFSDTDVFTVTIASAVPTLTISIPDMAIAPDGGKKTIDLWDYTTYHADKAALIYTVTQTYGESYLAAELTGGHYVSMTSLTSITPRHADIEVEVSDGDLSDSTEFEVELNNPPELDFFYGGLNELPDPVYVYAGRVSTLTLDDGETAVPLEFYAYDYEDGTNLAFSIANSPPVSLGIAIYYFVDGHYVTFDPDVELIGTHPIEVQVQDSVGLTGTDTFTVTVLQRAFLPLVLNNYPPIPTLHPIDNPDGDGSYWVEWDAPMEGYLTYELQYALSPDFSGATSINRSSEYYQAFTMVPGTYYWRVRVWSYPWSQVQSVTVGNFAYLYIEPLCAFGLRVELSGNGNYYVQEYGTEYCNTTVYWRSVPAGTYTTKLTWIGGSIVDQFGPQYLGNNEYFIDAGDRPSQWELY
jgi:hypothetical protein